MNAILFPGQGVQTVGMMDSLFGSSKRAKDLFVKASEVIDVDLVELVSVDSKNLIDLTEYSQPIILASSIALAEHHTDKANFNFCAGLSLGEYSALVYSECLDFLDAIKLVHIRGQLMQNSVAPDEAKMLVIMGMNHDDINSLIKELSLDGCKVDLSTDTADGMGVLAGKTENIEKCKTLLESKELRRVKTQYVNMSVPSHCYLLKDAQEKLAIELEKIELTEPSIPIISNFTALPTSNIDEIKNNLINQLCETVRWRETLDFLSEKDVRSITDSGPGKTIIGMARKFKEIEKLALVDS